MFTVEKAAFIFGTLNSYMSWYVFLKDLCFVSKGCYKMLLLIIATVSEPMRHTGFKLPVGKSNMLETIHA